MKNHPVYTYSSDSKDHTKDEWQLVIILSDNEPAFDPPEERGREREGGASRSRDNERFMSDV